MKLQNKNILVTGNNGFIGKNICRFLIDKSANVIGVDHSTVHTEEWMKNLMKFEQKDVTDWKTFEGLQKDDIDVVFHLASPSSIILYNKDPAGSFNTTVDSFINVMKFAKETGAKIVYPSSGSCYGSAKPPQSEKTVPEPLNMYAIAKLAVEGISKTYPDVDTTFLRIFAGYGPYEHHKGEFASPAGLFLEAIMNNQRPVVYGDGSQSRDFVFSNDIVKAFVNSTKFKGKHTINVATGKSYTFNETIQIINKICDKDIKPVHIKKPINYLERTQADISLMKRMLKIKPIDLEKGLKIYATFILDNRIL